MSIASEITRLLKAKLDIFSSIVNKGVEVPTGTRLSDCADLISAIPSGSSSFSPDDIVYIVPIDKLVVVDRNGYIGYNITSYFMYEGGQYYYGYAILSKSDDFSTKGLGKVTFYTPSSSNIGGREYNTVIIGGKEWMSENLDFKFSGLYIGSSKTSSIDPKANYPQKDEETYGINGNRYGLLYNWAAVKYLDDNREKLIPGWHVSTVSEWDDLVEAVGGSSIAGTKLKSTTGWNNDGNGDGTYGFEAFPAGYQDSGFAFEKQRAFFWTNAGGTAGRCTYRSFRYNSTSITAGTQDMSYSCSVRLVKDVPSA
jgi:uncharacterized protein (TIGR02145 family)